MFLKVNLYSLCRHYTGSERIVGSGRNNGLEKLNIHRIFLAPQKICQKRMTFSIPTLKVLQRAPKPTLSPRFAMLVWNVGMHHPVSGYSQVHENRHCRKELIIFAVLQKFCVVLILIWQPEEATLTQKAPQGCRNCTGSSLLVWQSSQAGRCKPSSPAGEFSAVFFPGCSAAGRKTHVDAF